MKMLMMVLALFLLVGCATTPFPECNKGLPPDAQLTKIAMNRGVCLQDVGSAIIIANRINISIAKLYTASQALSAVDKISEALEKPLTDLFFQKLVYDYIGAFPELLLITDTFKSDFGTGVLLDDMSRGMLREYLAKRVRPLLLARVSAAG